MNYLLRFKVHSPGGDKKKGRTIITFICPLFNHTQAACVTIHIVVWIAQDTSKQTNKQKKKKQQTK